MKSYGTQNDLQDKRINRLDTDRLTVCFTLLGFFLTASLIIGFVPNCDDCLPSPFSYDDFDANHPTLTDPLTNCTYRASMGNVGFTAFYRSVSTVNCPDQYDTSGFLLFLKAYFSFLAYCFGIPLAAVFIGLIADKKEFLIKNASRNFSSMINYTVDIALLGLSSLGVFFPSKDRCHNPFFISGFFIKLLHLIFLFGKHYYLSLRDDASKSPSIGRAHSHNELKKLRGQNNYTQVLILMFLLTGMSLTIWDKNPLMCKLGQSAFFIVSFLSGAALRYFSGRLAKAKKNFNDWKGNPALFQSRNWNAGGNLSSRPLLTTTDGLSFRHYEVAPDGDCGYTAFGTLRADAYDLLSHNLNKVSELLKSIVEESLLDSSFISYLAKRQDIPRNLLADYNNYQNAAKEGGEISDAIINNLKRHANQLSVLQAYVDYDVRDKKIEHGWCHPAVLQALAKINKVSLYIWQKDENGNLIPHIRHSQHILDDIDERIDLLFVNNNHFERLELMIEPEEHHRIKYV